jgi:manganese-dependent inorganic pyrophosphatase
VIAQDNPVFVFGHRNPDTDAICSAIAYADLLQRTTRPNAVAACCGTPNQRTEFALRKANVSHPRIVMDVRPEVGNICKRDVVTARAGDVFFDVYNKMKERELRAIPVVDIDRRVVGQLSLLDMMSLVFAHDRDNVRARTVTTSLQRVCQVLEGEFQHEVEIDQCEELITMVGAMSAEGFTKRLNQYPAERLIVVSGDRPTIHMPALKRGVRALVVTGGFELAPQLEELARAKNVTVITTPFDTATTTIRIRSAQVIDQAIDANFETLSDQMPMEDAKLIIERSNEPILSVVDDHGKLVGVISKSDLVKLPKPKLVLVDHNELAQAVQGAEQSEILEVLDHHRLGGGLKSSQPIRFINEPVGSTCTLVARQFRAAGLTPTSGIALCMASGIISDTLNLRSPTATDVDREILAWLEPITGHDLDTYAREFFEVGSALRSCTPEQVINEDCKEFTERHVRFSISQIEEIGFELFWQRKNELLEVLEKHANDRGLDFSALLVTDIVSNGSLLLLSHESDAWEEINYPRLDRNLYELQDVVSRKKQLLPLFAQLIASTPFEAVSAK